MIGTDLKLDRGGQRYEAPAVDVLEIRGEGEYIERQLTILLDTKVKSQSNCLTG